MHSRASISQNALIRNQTKGTALEIPKHPCPPNRISRHSDFRWGSKDSQSPALAKIQYAEPDRDATSQATILRKG